MSSDYETKWAEHQLSGEANTDAVTSSQTATAGGAGGFVGGSIATSGNGDGGIKAVSRDGPSDGFESCGSFARRGENHDSVRNVTVDAIQCPTFFSVRPEVTPRNRYIKVEEKMTYKFLCRAGSGHSAPVLLRCCRWQRPGVVLRCLSSDAESGFHRENRFQARSPARYG